MRVERMSNAFKKFWFEPASALPLAVIRIGAALILLAQAYMTRQLVFEFFSSSGFLQSEVAQSLNQSRYPQISWLVDFLAKYHVTEATTILFVCGLYVVSLLFLALGMYSRLSAVMSWFLHWLLLNSSESTTYGVDIYAHVFLFYLIFVPAGDALSLDAYFKGRFDKVSSAARLGLRVMQIQMCFSYLSAGLLKIAGPQWRDGEVIWRALSLPVYKQYDMTWMAYHPMLPLALAWATLILEIGYVIFIWPRATRWIWITGIVGLHLGIAVFLGLTLFGLIMTLLTVSLFAFPRLVALIEPWSVKKTPSLSTLPS